MIFTPLKDEGNKAIKPALDLLLMEEETADHVAVPEELHGPVSVDERADMEPQGARRGCRLLIQTTTLSTVSAHAQQKCCQCPSFSDLLGQWTGGPPG